MQCLRSRTTYVVLHAAGQWLQVPREPGGCALECFACLFQCSRDFSGKRGWKLGYSSYCSLLFEFTAFDGFFCFFLMVVLTWRKWSLQQIELGRKVPPSGHRLNSALAMQAMTISNLSTGQTTSVRPLEAGISAECYIYTYAHNRY